MNQDGLEPPLAGRVAVVAGATRGAGRGIARALGEAGAFVVCTGRSTAGHAASGRPETIEETAGLIEAAGGRAVAVVVDHSIEGDVERLFARVRAEHGRLDVLVNDIWGGDALTQWGAPFWELDAAQGQELFARAVFTHVLTSRHGVPLLRETGRGLVVEITDGDAPGYRGNLYYDLAKNTVSRLAYAMATELAGTAVTALAVTPGFLRSEAVLEHFGVTEDNWRDGAKQDRHFVASETPLYVGRAVAVLAADPDIGAKAGRTWSSGALAKEYGFTDADGRQPDFDAYFDGEVAAILDRRGPADDDEKELVLARWRQLHLDPERVAETDRMAAALGIDPARPFGPRRQ